MKAKDLHELRTGSQISFFVKEQGYNTKAYFQGVRSTNPFSKTVEIAINIAGIGHTNTVLRFEDEVTVVETNRYYHLNGVEAISYFYASAQEIGDFIDDRKGQDWIDENIKAGDDWIVKVKGVLIRLSDEQFQALTDGFEED